MCAESSYTYPPGELISQRLDAMRQVEDRGFTFIGAPGEREFISFASLGKQMHERGLGLLSLGLKPQDPVALILADPKEFVLNFLAVVGAGLIPVPLYPPLGLGKLDGWHQTTARILERAHAKMLITDDRVQHVAWRLVDEVPSLQRIIVSDKVPVVSGRLSLDAKLDDVVLLQFTSGSTALPKGVVVTHETLFANLEGMALHALCVEPGDVVVSWLPLYHDMGLIGMMMGSIWTGISAVLLSPVEFLKRPARWLELMSEYRATISFAPNFAFALATRRVGAQKLAELDLSSVKALGCGAEPNHPDTLRAFLDHFQPAGLSQSALFPCYGMAEATLAISFVHLDEELKSDVVDADTYHMEQRAVPADESSQRVLEFVDCGATLPDHSVRIIDEQGRELGAREVGQIVYEGPSVARGYFEDPEKTADVFHVDGLRTQDLGYIADGRLYVTGRLKDLIILNGRNYDPHSIEWLVAEIDGVRKGNVVAFSVPTARSEELVVVAETKAASEALADEIKTRVRTELGITVRHVELLEPGQLPKTSSGKLQRNLTRTLHMEGALGSLRVRTPGSAGERWTIARHVTRSAISRARHEITRRGAATVQNLFVRSSESPHE